MYFSLNQYVFFFFTYAFLGWIADVVIAAFKHGKFVNKGFLNAPLSIHYGFGMVIIIQDIKDLTSHPMFQYITCLFLAFFMEYTSGALLKWIAGKRFWDYSNHKFNLSGHTCLLSIVATGSAAAITFWLFHPFLCVLYSLIPKNIMQVILIVLLLLFAIDVLVTIATVRKWHRVHVVYKNVAKGLTDAKKSIGKKTFEMVSRRIYKAFPEMEHQEKSEKVGFGKAKDRVFANGLCFDKLVWVFFVSAFLGDLIETVFMLITTKTLMSRSSLIYGTFSIVWGLGGALASALLYPIRKKNPVLIFGAGFVLGGVYEYTCSVFTEVVFGTVFWDYSHMKYNINGRVNLLFCVFWGAASILWIKLIYPIMSNSVEKFPVVAGKVVTWAFIVCMVLDMLVSGVAIGRYTSRKNEKEAANYVEQLCDELYKDDLIEKVYPNMKFK